MSFSKKLNTSKSTAISPTKTNVSYNNSGFTTPQNNHKVKAFTPFGSSAVKKSPSQSFFKAVSLTPNVCKPKESASFARGREIAVLHESKIFRKLLDAASKKEVQRRDPILQNNSEPAQIFRPCVRRLASSDRMSENKDELFRRTKKTGDFNERFNPRNPDPKPEGIKTYIHAPSESEVENYRFCFKSVRGVSEVRRDPIIDGDFRSGIIRHARKPRAEEESVQQRMNDKRYLLPADRGASVQGQVSNQTFNFGEAEPVTPVAGSQSSRSLSRPRPLTAQQLKMRGSIKGVLEYEEGPRFRQDVVTGKINSMSYCSTPKQDDVCVFGRKKTLEY